MEHTKQNIAFFDFDGTITNKDSLVEFIKFAVGKKRYYTGLIQKSPMLILYKLKIIPNDQAKMRLLDHYFKDLDEKIFKNKASKYSLEHIDSIVKPKALEKIRYHKQNGDKVVIVSASLECWLKPWCDRENLELISTKLLFKDGKFSSNFDGKNCYGKEKELRIKKRFDLNNYNQIYAYGDSSGDKQMLLLAHHPHYKPF